MSSVVGRIAAAIVLVTGVVPGVHGQTVAEQRARVTALAAQLHSLTAKRDSIERATDTIDVEGVRFVVPPRAQARAEEVARRALAELERQLGSQDRQLLNGWVSTVLERRFPAADGSRATVATVVGAAGSQRLRDLGGSALYQWSDWWRPEERDLEGAYLDLITLPASGATKCFEGETQACAALLALTPGQDPWQEALDAAQRRRLVAQRLAYLRSPRGGALMRDRSERFRQCVDGEVDDACLNLLHTYWGTFSSLVSARTKRSVMLVARSLGGEGTFSRLVADTTAPLGARLSAAAGAPLDSLLRAWHARVLEAEPAPTRVGPVAGWTSFLVILIAGALAMRSTRWRLG